MANTKKTPNKKSTVASAGTRRSGVSARRPSSAASSRRNGACGRSPARPARGANAKRHTAASHGKRFRLRNPKKLLRLLPMLLIPALLITMLFLIQGADLRDTFSVPKKADSSKNAVSTIEGISLSGLSREQAAAELKSAATTLLASIDLLIKDGEVELRLTSAFIEADTNLEELLTKIYDQGQSGTYSLTVSADGALLQERLSSIASSLGDPPVEPYAVASLNENNVQRFEIHEGKSGTVMDIDATAAAVQSALAARDFQAQIAPVMKDSSPEMSTEFIKENTKRIATFTTRFRDSESNETIANRVFNINKAAGIISGCCVSPSQEWSFNDYVGLRTVDGGWKEANGITGGKEYSLQAGGGICQVSTTLYNALLRANIEVTDRKAHSIPSEYVDKGLDATVDSGGIDLKFINDTGAPLYIFAYIKPDEENSRYSTITVSLYGKPLESGVSYECRSEITDTNERTDTRFTYSDSIPEGYELTTVTRHDGYTAEVYRDKIVNGEVESSTLLYTDKYRGNVAEITIGTGDPSTVSAPSGAEKSGSTASEAG